MTVEARSSAPPRARQLSTTSFKATCLEISTRRRAATATAHGPPAMVAAARLAPTEAARRRA
jgi:hypothetical protein